MHRCYRLKVLMPSTHAVVLFLGLKGLSIDNTISTRLTGRIYNYVGVVTFTFAAYDGFIVASCLDATSLLLLTNTR